VFLSQLAVYSSNLVGVCVTLILHKIIPDVLISGGNNEGSGVAGLMGLKMMEMMSTAKLEKDKPAS
jgi:hypothetical protein